MLLSLVCYGLMQHFYLIFCWVIMEMSQNTIPLYPSIGKCNARFMYVRDDINDLSNVKKSYAFYPIVYGVAITSSPQ